MENPVEEIKRKIDIVDFIGSHITLKKSGRNFKAVCPFHQEKTPSFVVSPERQIWHCFGACGEGGDIIKFLMKWENITFYEALKDLAQKLRIRLKKVGFEDKVWKKKERLIEINNLTTQYYQYILNKTRYGTKGKDYLSNREINPKIIDKFRLGYAPLSWKSLFSFLRRKHYEPEEVSETGLIIKGNKDYYDRFRGRLIFPITNPRGEIIGFSGRVIESKKNEAKYINTPETLLYHKRETLFGIDLAKEMIKKEGNVFLVEGEFDMISPFQQGIENVVAIKGSAVTKEQLMLLKRYVNRINLFLDADPAGEEAIKRSVEEIESLDIEASVVLFDYAKDPDEAVRSDLVKFKKIIKSPIPIYDFLLNFFQKKYSISKPFGKKKIGDEMVIYLEKIKNPIVQSHYIKQLANLLSVSDSIIEGLIRKLKYKTKRKMSSFVTTKSSHEQNRDLILQKYLLSFIFQSNDPYQTEESVSRIVNLEDFSFPAYQKVYQSFLEYKKNHPGQFNLQKFAKVLAQEQLSVFDEIYLFASHDIELETKNAEKISYQLKKTSLKRKITELLSSKEEMAEEKRKQLRELNKQLNQVEKTIVLL
ncbi:DNA primase [Candidatus Roizmanbacteria bacterium CG_4_10_14_0_8_um_filter_36_36]|uniref:DNA primase n=2 Tax=Candidatus Roizmaniibacteriota TaxID=1752723 RepID=A0A2M8KK32_9BACT|nr:MAG: DNA primase [Candidatus Roizmanbacteria bacterium CG03_land_8_20_14_0_80_36_21]PIY69770.1 MAG: DNA primase [Candidatus Roizmanbacteria bacterium CG_4_10_14_0_8_um_filter_36_36]PJA53161.1 MAG: DNA primase [Candidatus Roizmanbacteria bacterium CG_4_9_14_3_um_filter_36_11]PJC81505.1 MAG: DNA primase [Candidatus Roizmanbacteria bacterium CG_4_8_14_3_um_filter_36_10]PJE60277.1 MAG: DNA primase [Candidatus Roizmanbacteria bacterium CG10_big_fil_rev_8_21_14_0_10_36_26]